MSLSKQDRVIRAQQLMGDELLQEALAEMRRLALNDFLSAHRWWWGDRKRRLAAERLREVQDFGTRLEMLLRTAPQERVPEPKKPLRLIP